MGYALYVTFDRPIPGVEGWNLCGKTLARNLETLDAIARASGLPSLSDLISISDEELADFLDETLEEGLDEQWFSPVVGLATLQLLIPAVQENSERFDQPSQLLDDLDQVKQYLEQAEQHQALFHLTPDF